jgi:hypothetical protein
MTRWYRRVAACNPFRFTARVPLESVCLFGGHRPGQTTSNPVHFRDWKQDRERTDAIDFRYHENHPQDAETQSPAVALAAALPTITATHASLGSEPSGGRSHPRLGRASTRSCSREAKVLAASSEP